MLGWGYGKPKLPHPKPPPAPQYCARHCEYYLLKPCPYCMEEHHKIMRTPNKCSEPGCPAYAYNNNSQCFRHLAGLTAPEESKPSPAFRLDLSHVPGFFVRALAAPFMIGAVKYSRGDWAASVKTADQAKEACDRRLGSLLNHLTTYMDGENYDVDGFHHLAAVAWGALYILFLKCKFLGHKMYLEDVLVERLQFHKENKAA